MCRANEVSGQASLALGSGVPGKGKTDPRPPRFPGSLWALGRRREGLWREPRVQGAFGEEVKDEGAGGAGRPQGAGCCAFLGDLPRTWDLIPFWQNRGPGRSSYSTPVFRFWFCFGCTHGMWEFLGQGSNPCHSSNPNHCSDNGESVICCAKRKLLHPRVFHALGFCL